MNKYLGPDAIFGNPASRSHAFGWLAEEAVETARAQVAELVHCDSREIIWTSGATESNNLAIKGVALASRQKRHVITSKIEHKSVIDPAIWLESQGYSVTFLQPSSDGLIEPELLEKSICAETCLVSLMLVNNEIGTINDIVALGEICRKKGILFHVDAAQATGKIKIDLASTPVDLMSFSAHKTYGPKGIGALYVRRGQNVVIAPQIHGGGHERGLRSGTLATHQIAGMGLAFDVARTTMDSDLVHIRNLNALFFEEISGVVGVHLNGSRSNRVPHNINLRFDDVSGDAMINALTELAVSNGSACNSASFDPSYVLTGIGLSREQAEASIRISLGRFTTSEHIIRSAELIRRSVTLLRLHNY